MYIRIAANGELSLRDGDNMRAFSIVEEVAGDAVKRLAEIASPTVDNQYWFDAEAVIEISGRGQDRQWVSAFRAMLAGVAAYGYYDEATKRVKAHVEYRDA